MYNVLEGTLLRAMHSPAQKSYAHCLYLSDLSRLVSTYEFKLCVPNKKSNYIRLIDLNTDLNNVCTERHTRSKGLKHLNMLLNKALKEEHLAYHAKFVQRRLEHVNTYVVEAVKIGYQHPDDPLIKVFTI